MEAAPSPSPAERREPTAEELRAWAEETFRRYQRDFNLSEEELRGALLDVGAGSGLFVRHVREALGNERAVGLDSSPVRAAVYPGVAVGSGDAIPFPDGAFQTVVAHNYLPMFLAPGPRREPAERHVAEMLRVAAPGGRVYFDVSRLDAMAEEIVSGLMTGAPEEVAAEVERVEREEIPGMRRLGAFLDGLVARGEIEFEERVPRPKEDSTGATYVLRKKENSGY